MGPQSVTLLACAGLLVLSCGPGPDARSGAAGADRAASAPRTLRMGMHVGEAPDDGIALFGPGGTGGPEHTYAFHAGLTIYDAQGNLLPQVAQKVPTVEDGDWIPFPDGRMEVTWKLRPNIKWHDGALLTADDFVFGTQVAMDPELPHRRGRQMSLISQVVAPDPQTLVVRWKQTYMLANMSGPIDVMALPRHLAADLYRTDKQAFINSPLWTREFIGLGPYRLSEWVLGSHMEGLAFDDYVLGRPKIDRIVIRYFGDLSGLVAGLLSGEVDMTPMGSLKTEQLVTMKNVWEATGAGTVVAVKSGVRAFFPQFRDPGAPLARDASVRRALLHMLDRQTIADTLQHGLTISADTLVPPEDSVYRLLEQRGLAKYPYDLGRAERLLADAGWRRGPDGGYRSETGERLTVEVTATSRSPQNVQEAEAVADQWKSAGLNAAPNLIPPTGSTQELLARSLSGFIWPLMGPTTAMESFITSQITSQQNRWQGANRSGYSNPVFDRLYDEYATTLDITKRQGLLADLLKFAADEAIYFPLYYSFGTETAAVRKGIRGPGPVAVMQLVTVWNIHQWEME